MAEGHIHGESSVEVQTESDFEEMLILSRVYKPRCRLLGVSSYSEEAEKSEESTTSDNKDVEPRLFRSRSTVSGSRNVHKWKNVSLI